MLKGHPEICLFQPEIPQNAGNIGRLVAATASRLHIITPCGFSLKDKNLRRAGLDYWPYLDLEIHSSIDELLKLHDGQVAFFSAKTSRSYRTIPNATTLLVFGQETKGLPSWLHENYAEFFYKLPIFHPGVRSLNLANAVAVATYDYLGKKGLG